MKGGGLKSKLALVVLGRSGSGKGTQARLLLKRLEKQGVHHMETGRFLRGLLEMHDNPTIEITRRTLKRGDLLPSWLAAFTWLKELIEKGNADKHLVFDGAPRRLWEAQLMDEVMRWHGRMPPLCILIEVPRQEVARRLLARGRADDTPRAIRHRLSYFSKYVLPVIRYYERHKRLVRVDGMPAPEVIGKSIDAVLSRKLGRLWPKTR